MKKQTLIKIISGFILFVFIVFIFQFALPIQAATNTSLYSNPNQNNSRNPYQFKVSDVINSSMLTSVVGCTGIVNKVSKWMTSFMQSGAVKEQIKDKARLAAIEQVKSACKTGKAASETTAQALPTMPGFAKPVGTILSKLKIKVGTTPVQTCLEAVDSISLEEIDALTKSLAEDKAANFKTQCFDGIAITLAKNQLTAMTRSAMNWVNSGYGGNPFFVQNMQRLTYNLEKNVIETGIDIMLAPQNANPYAADFSRATLTNKGIMASSSKFLGGLQSDLSNFITDPQSYYTNEQLTDAQKTQKALQNARNANASFSRSFATGGWNAWLALTQREQNNPLGFNMVANQYLSDMQSQVVSDTRNELAENNGFMSQKECIKWQMYNKDKTPKIKKVGTAGEPPKVIGVNTDGTLKLSSGGLMQIDEFVFVDQQPRFQNYDGENEYGVCVDKKTITPGSIIRDKTTNYLNSPERQLELAKTINDSLNALFSILISKLESGGLFGLSDSAVNTNWTDNMNTLLNEGGSDSSGNSYSNNGAYDNFELTRDLGNTYVHDMAYDYGTWNAKDNWTTTKNALNNNKKLYPNLNPEIYDTTTGDPIITNSAFYTVDTAGTTKLINEGYNNWEKGDRAYWNGTEWQNWKCAANANGECTNQKSPIANRGVIQKQEDYIVAAKEIIGVLPGIMTKLGELDYCIPGPNPSYKTNSAEAQSTYQDWVGTIYARARDYTDAKHFDWGMDAPGDPTYTAFLNIFSDNMGVFREMNKTGEMALLLTNRYPNLTEWDSKTVDEKNAWNPNEISFFPDYKWKAGDNVQTRIQLLRDKNIDYTNNSLFQNFYEVFDKMMNDVYFKSMINPYLEKENSSEKLPNPGYIPMAESGLDITKDIVYYNDDINQKIEEYGDAMDQAKTNIAKLKPIRDEVSGIIKAAQDRRDAKLLTQINNINAVATDTCKATQIECDNSTENLPQCLKEYNDCISKATTSGKILSKEDYLKKYAACLSEEDIKVYDADGIIGMGDKDEERCSDGFDNDGNGLVDCKDPACSSKDPVCLQTNSTNFKCLATNDHDVNAYLLSSGDGWSRGKLNAPKYTTTPCESRSQTTCSNEYVYAGPSLHISLFNGNYNSYKVKSCVWANVKPINGQCSIALDTTNEIHSYVSDIDCRDGKCVGRLEASKYLPTLCSRRGPKDCSATESVTAGPTKVKSGWLGLDPYFAYTVNKCEWTN
ncbi:MAG: hypothetical protein WCW65_02790 [Candidatus Paceibacterota bacterium]